MERLYTFGEALEAVKNYKRISRKGWNASGMFVYYVPEGQYAARTKIMKDHFGEESLVPYRAYLALKTAQEDVATWVPSISDLLSDDWQILD